MSRRGGISIADLGPAARKQVTDKILSGAAGKEKRTKYNASAVVYDGHRFDSKKEMQHYMLLKAKESDGEIWDLRVQPAWRIEVRGVFICDYVADFSFRYNIVSATRPPLVVVDAKSAATHKIAAFQLKKKLMYAVHHIEVVEV